MRRLLDRFLREEDGIALVLALAIMMILAVTTTGILTAGTENQRSALVSDREKQAFAIAQEGLAYAEGMVYNAAANDTTPSTGVRSLPTLPIGSGTYYASVGSDGTTWTMHGTGTVSGVTRSVWAEATVPGPATVTDTGVWNYVYADASGSSCATTLNGTVTISVPILIKGDLCLGGSLNFTGSQLEVGGNLSVTGSAKIGSATSKIQTLRVGLGSSSTSTCQGVTAGTGVCNGNTSPIYATSVSEGMDLTPQMPCIGQPSSWDSQCTGTNNGTWTSLHQYYNAEAASTKTGCPANLFDNNSTLDNSDTSISSVMFGNTDYDCKVGTANEIKWTHSSKTLFVKGTLYFDGSLTLSGNVTYTGQASFYFTGGMQTTGGPTFCGIANCTGSWNPDVNGIVMVFGCWADSTGATLITSSSGCVGLGGGTTVQLGLYVTTKYTTSGGSSNMGPVLANSLNLGGNAQTLIPFHYMPPGTPTNTRTVYLPATAPTLWAG